MLSLLGFNGAYWIEPRTRALPPEPLPNCTRPITPREAGKQS
jgi:hypothetical protein